MEIPFPGDDPDAMTLLCLTLHMQNDRLPEPITVSQLREFAALVDKYDCAPAVKFASTFWLKNLWNDPSIQANEQHALLASAFLMDDTASFYEISYWMVVNCTPKEIDDMASCKEVLPDAVYRLLAQTIRKIQDKLSHQIQVPITEMSRAGTDGMIGGSYHGMNTTSGYQMGHHDFGRVTSYILQLSAIGMWPINPSAKSISSQISLLKNFPGLDDPFKATRVERNCKACNLNVKERNRLIILSALKLIRGLSLECLVAEECHFKEKCINHD